MFEEIHKFVHETLGLTVDHIVRLQMNHAQNCVHIKCRELQTALDIVEKHHEKHEIEVNKTKVRVRLVMDDGGVEVKLHDLSENIRNEEIVAFLKQYGDVITIKDQIWSENYPLKGVPTGVRIAKMILRRHIKSFVTIQGEQSLVTYRNQIHTCKHCTNPSHPGSTCVENKKLLGQKSDLNDRLKIKSSNSNQPASFANVVNNTVPSLMPTFVTLNESAYPALASSVDDSSITSSNPSPVVPNQSGELLPTASGSKQRTQPIEMTNESAKQNSSGAPNCSGSSGTKEANQQAKDQSTLQAQSRSNDEATTSSVSPFKIPSKLRNSQNFSMDISDSDSYESLHDNSSFQKVLRGGRSKKQKIDPKPDSNKISTRSQSRS